VVASPKGGVTFVDPTSIQLNKDDAYCTEFLNTKQSLWTETEKLSEFVGKASEFEAIFVVGGFGPMYDLVSDPITIQLLREFYEADKFVTAVCHGSAALVNVKLADGTNLIANEAVTGFSNEEDEAFLGFFPEEEVTPFLLQDALTKASGGKYEKSLEAWSPLVLVSSSKKLLTGQNPASAGPLGKALLEKLSL
jgi:putative intracellular protease/amidase